MLMQSAEQPDEAARWGATPQEWMHWDLIAGFGGRLLPVVSNPEAEISPRSTLKAKGKVPSTYNSAGQIVGMTNWTLSRDDWTRRQIDKWAEEPDFGICIRTGGPDGLVAIDIDSDNAEQVKRALGLAADHLGVLPRRIRARSERAVLLLRVEGEPVYKRVCHLAGDERIEVLGEGQQFIAGGTHQSGERYDWLGGPPDEVPLVAADRFEGWWTALNAAMGVKPPSQARSGPRQRGETIDLEDPRARWLEEQGLVIGGDEGRQDIVCPFAAGHSMDSGPSATSYFPAGTGGYTEGRYKCMHASCEGRSVDEYDEALGYYEASRAAALVDISEVDVPIPPGETGRRPGFALNKTKTAILATVSNLDVALRATDWTGVVLGYDEFLCEVMFARGDDRWRVMSDNDRTEIRVWLERQSFMKIADRDLAQIIRLVARDQSFDSAQQWLEGLVWDKVPRVAQLLPRYFGAEASPYAVAVGCYWMTGHAARVIDPGHQCDMVPILISPEGCYKSTSLAGLVPFDAAFIEIDLNHKDDDLARRMRGALLGEIAELRGLQGRSADANKAWVTRRDEHWVPKYMESTQRNPRRLIFVGTTNENAIIDGNTGERRWLPITVGEVDREALKRDRDQLWAEAAVMYRQRGHVWWEEAYQLGPKGREAYQTSDSWEDAIENWYEDMVKNEGLTEFSTRQALAGAIGLADAQCGRAQEMRMAKVLRMSGFTGPHKMRKGDKFVRHWRKEEMA